LPSKNPTTYSVVKYDGSKVVITTRGGNKEYNYVEGEMYEVAKFKVKAADDAAILINGFTLVDGATDVSRL
jgi:plasmid rolling circle replication initiator protein Rep